MRGVLLGLRGFTPRHYKCDLGHEGESMKDAYGEEISNGLDDIRKVLSLILLEIKRYNDREESILERNERGVWEE
jgi:hypothetical protein